MISKNVKSKVLVYLSILVALLGIAGVAYASFSDKSEVAGAQISVGSADLRLFDDVALGLLDSNLVDSKVGPSFENIGKNWQGDYLIKLFNNGTEDVGLYSNANYETSLDPDDLRGEFSVEMIEWNDTNSDGLVTDDELGVSYGEKTIIKWKTEGFDLGSLETGGVKGLVLRFSASDLPDSKQGTSFVFDFEFSSVGLSDTLGI